MWNSNGCTSSFMGGLGKESSNFPFSGSGITSSTKATKRPGSINECIITIEIILSLTSIIIAMLKHLIKHGI